MILLPSELSESWFVVKLANILVLTTLCVFANPVSRTTGVYRTAERLGCRGYQSYLAARVIPSPYPLTRMRLCRFQQCQKIPSFNDEGSKTPILCKQHAEDGMVCVGAKRCKHGACTRRPSFNVDGSKTAVYCKQHADDGMVNVVARRCSHDACTKIAYFSIEGSKPAVYCKQHAEDGMVNVVSKRCLYDNCKNRPSFNVEGSRTAVYCKQHAEDGMVNVVSKLCSHDNCKKWPSFHVEGSRTGVYCKQHAEDGMVNVIKKSRSVDTHTPESALGVPTKVEANACARSKRGIYDGSVMRSDSSFEMLGCRKRSNFKLDEKQLPEGKKKSPVSVEIAQTVRNVCSMNVRQHPAHRVLRRRIDENPVRAVPMRTQEFISPVPPPSPDQIFAGKPIKTEMELVVKF